MRTTLFLAALVMAFQITEFRAEAQVTRKISGIVTCFKNIPLNNVKVSATKSGNIAYSDSSGQFTIETLNKDQMEITAAGFNSKKVKTGKDVIYQINLVYSNKKNSFNEAVRNNHVREEVLQKAIYINTSAKQKDYSRYENIFDLIDNEIYNVRVNGTSVTNYKIRSFDTKPQVLYVVDEKIVTDISYINPVYVKSIEFVEDVGATLYGSKGANGVLKITLK